MRAKFLTDSWFDLVKSLADAAGDLHVPPALSKMVMNLVVETDGGNRNANIRSMIFSSGHDPEAPVALFMDEQLARALFVDGKTEAGLFAFMSGEMRVEGDVSKIMVPMTTLPSAEMLALGERIKSLTD